MSLPSKTVLKVVFACNHNPTLSYLYHSHPGPAGHPCFSRGFPLIGLPAYTLTALQPSLHRVILWKCKSDHVTPLLKPSSVSPSHSEWKPKFLPLFSITPHPATHTLTMPTLCYLSNSCSLCSWNKPNPLLPQVLCLYSLLCQECSSYRLLRDPLPHFIQMCAQTFPS